MKSPKSLDEALISLYLDLKFMCGEIDEGEREEGSQRDNLKSLKSTLLVEYIRN
jgi:hypothetical protein